jgi:hypothetical protein
MRRARGCLVFTLLVLPVLSLGCDQSSKPVPTQCVYDRFLREIVPDAWQEVTPQEVTGDEESPDEEWVVFYRDGDPSNPIDAAVYRLSSDAPPLSSDETPSFVACVLDSPYDGHMCECECKAERTNLLSAYEGTELVIRDKCVGAL